MGTPRLMHQDVFQGQRLMRAAFFAAGLFVTLWGVSFLFVDRVVLKDLSSESRGGTFRGMFTSMTGQRQKVIDPPDWSAFCMMSVGAVTMLYAFALPKKKQE